VKMPTFAAEAIDGFAIWTPAQLKAHEEGLSKKVGPDHSSRETLADYKTHRFRMLCRDADGAPEQHDTIIDVVMVQSGEAHRFLVPKGKHITYVLLKFPA
jgi:hypothetical protein